MTASSTSSAARTALRCLVHPATLASVVLLIVNDHLLKASHPGWLTGKLSDFAGLFFFPFLLALAISLIARIIYGSSAHETSARRIGAISFGVTALWFAAAKGTALGNAATIEAISRLLGHRVSIVLDPGDLIALAMLWPAWLLWRKMAGNPERSLSIRTAIPAVILASIGVMATPSQSGYLPARFNVIDLHTERGILYARTAAEDWRHVFRTIDNGRTWKRILGAEADTITMQAEEMGTRPATVRHPRNPRELFESPPRLPVIDYSADSGATWKRTWLDSLLAPHRSRDYRIEVNDLMFTPDSSGTLLVAVADGVLIRDSIGRWSWSYVFD